MVIPCKNCLIMGICRHKMYGVLMYECDNLRNIMYKGIKRHPRLNLPMLLIGSRRDKTDKALLKLETVLKPTDWFSKWDERRERYKIRSRTFKKEIL